MAKRMTSSNPPCPKITSAANECGWPALARFATLAAVYPVLPHGDRLAHRLGQMRNLHRHWHSVLAARTCRSGWVIDLRLGWYVDRLAILVCSGRAEDE
jgi:hypothetical protein